MKIQIRCLDKDGNFLGLITGEALPRYPHLPAEEGCAVVLSAEDLDRLKKAFLRFERVADARQRIGDIGMSFTGASFTATKPPHPSDVKLMALEIRPFFLEKDPLCFGKLLSLPSLGKTECLRPCLKRHRKRWDESAFGGRMMISVGNQSLDTHSVVKAWFNDDFFHSESQQQDGLSLEKLVSFSGGENQAVTLLAHHIIESLRVIGEYFNDIYAVSSEFAAWAKTLPGYAEE